MVLIRRFYGRFPPSGLYGIVQHGQTVTSRIDADADNKIAAQKLLFEDELARLTAEVEGHAKNLGDIRASHATKEVRRFAESAMLRVPPPFCVCVRGARGGGLGG